MPWVTSERMTLDIRNCSRLLVIGVIATMVMAAGEFPTAPMAAAHAVIESSQSTSEAPADTAGSDEIASADGDPLSGPRPAHLSQLVGRMIDAAPAAVGDRECLARAVYFEARGEPLEGQLAVAEVILNRVASGRFADTVCGVINQRGQFSFNRARVPADGHDWRTAKAIAAIAATAGWSAIAPNATAFHATRVNASWTTLHKVGTIGNHIFYR